MMCRCLRWWDWWLGFSVIALGTRTKLVFTLAFIYFYVKEGVFCYSSKDLAVYNYYSSRLSRWSWYNYWTVSSIKFWTGCSLASNVLVIFELGHWLTTLNLESLLGYFADYYFCLLLNDWDDYWTITLLLSAKPGVAF